MRLFVSVDCHDLADEVARVQEPFRAPGLNPTDPEQAHVTLTFLGAVDDGGVDELTAALEAAVAGADVDPFDLALGGYGVFPSMDYISVVWLGVREGAGELSALHEAVESATVELDFDPADHEFTPHVTLARMDHAASKAAVQRAVSGRDPAAGRTRIESVRLKRSDLGPDGPEYSTVERFPL